MKYKTTYDKIFVKVGERYNLAPTLLKSQAIAESSLNLTAVNKKSGACGLMQILPSTYADILQKIPSLKDIFDPPSNILAGAFYLASQKKFWESYDVGNDSLQFALASYNWGAGNLIKKMVLHYIKNNTLKDCNIEIVYKKDMAIHYLKTFDQIKFNKERILLEKPALYSYINSTKTWNWLKNKVPTETSNYIEKIFKLWKELEGE